MRTRAGLAALDVSGAPVAAADVASLLCRLTHLRALSLSGCRRLTGALVAECLCLTVPPPTLAEHSVLHPARHLTTLNLQVGRRWSVDGQ
jgi:hypothetical protein